MAGLEALQKAHAEAQARKASFAEGYTRFARFNPGVENVVRFLEQGDDVQWCYVHEIMPVPGKAVPVTPCLNQDEDGTPCYGCESGQKRIIKGWINLIFRDAPVFKTDSNGRDIKDPISGAKTVIGKADQVQVWNQGTVVFSMLAQKDAKFKGLMSRDFSIVRNGASLETTYTVDPADPDGGQQAMSDADRALAAEKFNVRKFTIPESYSVQKQLLQGVPRTAIKNDEDAAPNVGLGGSNFDDVLRRLEAAANA